MKSIITIFTLFITGIVFAQTPGGSKPMHGREGREKIIRMKLDYVKENLGLTEAENIRFFPVYEENLKKEEALRQKQRGILRKIKQEYTSMADADIEKYLGEEMALEQQLLDLKKAQFDSYKKLIPIKKVVELKTVERAFNRMLMEKLRDKRDGGPPVPEEK